MEEGIQETVTAEVKELINFIWGTPEQAVPQSVISERVQQAARAGGLASAVLAGSGAGATVITETVKAKRAAKFYQDQVKTAAEVDATKLKKMSPSKTEELLTGSEADQTVYIDPDEAVPLFQEQKDIFDKVGIDENTFLTALNTGRNLDITLATMFARLPEKQSSELLKLVKEEQDALSLSESQKININEEIKRQLDIQRAVREEEITQQQNLNRIRNEIIQAGYTDTYAGGVTQLISGFSQRMALEGRDLTALTEKITVRKASAEDLALATRIQQKGIKPGETLPALPKGMLIPANEQYIMSLFENRDLSTVVHETGHIFLKELSQTAETEGISESFTKDWTIIKNWLKMPGEEFTVKNEEQFAKGFEQYLTEGKAPTKELNSVFSRFKNWLLTVYKKLRNLDVDLSDNMRGVFDRMIAAETEVDAFLDDLNLQPPQSVIDILTLNKEEASALKKSLSADYDSARNSLQQRIVKEQAQKLKIWKENAVLTVDSMPVYKLINDLNKRIIPPFDYDSTVREVNQNTVDKLAALKPKSITRTKNKGGHPGTAAADYGYENIPDMINDLLNAAPRPDKINELINQYREAYIQEITAADAVLNWTNGTGKYLNKLNEFLAKRVEFEQAVINDITGITPEMPGYEALAVIKNALRRRDDALRKADFDAAETYQKQIITAQEGLKNYLGKIKKVKGLEIKLFGKEIKKKVENDILLTEVSKVLNLKTSLTAMRKALRNKDTYVQRGDFSAVQKELEKALENYEYARQSKVLETTISKLRNRLKKAVKAEKKLPFDYQDNIQALGIRYGLIGGKIKPDKIKLDKLLKDGSDTDLTAVPEFDVFLYNDNDVRSYRKMAVAELLELDNLITYLDKKGRDLVNDRVLTEKVKLSLLIKELIEPAQKIKTRVLYPQKSVRRRIQDEINEYFARSAQLLFVMRRMDASTNIGAKGVMGPNEKYIWRAFSEASNNNSVLTNQVFTKLKPAIDQLYKSSRKYSGRLIENMPKRPASWIKEGRYWTFEHIVGIARLMGLEDNRTAVREGLGLTQAEIDQALSILTDNDWDAVQLIWDTFETLWPEMERIRTNVEFLRTKKIEPSPFRTPTGKILKGGYHPLAIDYSLTDKTRDQELINTIKDLYPSAFPYAATRNKFMTERVGFAGNPPRTDWGVMSRQFNFNVRYITHTELARDMSRLFKRNGEYYQTVKDKLGRETAELLIAVNKEEALPDKKQIGWLNTVRSMSTIWTLTYNEQVGAKQFFSLPNVIIDIGAKYFIKGGWDFVQDIPRALQTIEEMSPYMKNRSKSATREMQEENAKLSAPAGIVKTKWREINDFLGWLFIRLVDGLVVYPAWWSAYNKGLDIKGGDVNEARIYADTIIQASQPSSRPIDLSFYQRSPKLLYRWFSMFSTFMFKYGNQFRSYYHAWRQKTISNAEYASFVLLASIGTPVMMTAVFGKGKDDEPPGILDYSLGVATYNLSNLMFARDIVNLIQYSISTGKTGRNFWDSAIVSGFELGQNFVIALIRLMADMDEDKKLNRVLWTFAELTSFMVRFPATKIYKRLKTGMETMKEFFE
jgi:hypothetical protein